MFEFDWRPLIYLLTIAVFMLLWIVGCTIIADSGTRSSPTGYPQVTLTVGRIVVPAIPTDSPRPPQVSTSIRTATPGGGYPISPPFASPASHISAILLTPPICYAISSAMMRCLGRVDNSLAVAINRVSVRIRLFLTQGREIVRSAAIEQAVILPDGFAPYRVDFPIEAEAYAGVAVVIESGDVVDDPAVVALTVDTVEVSGSGAFRQVSAQLVGATTSLVLNRALITLIDSHGRVYGYQVLQFENRVIEPGERLAILARVQPQIDMVGLSAVVHVEARKP